MSINLDNKNAIVFEKEIPFLLRDPQFWNAVTVEGGKVVTDKQGRPVTPFRYDLIERIHETHKSRDGSIRHYSWREYEDEYGVVATIGDYRNISTQIEATFRVLEEVLQEHWQEEDYTYFFWPHNGEQLALKMLDGQYGMPTKLALWYYYESPFPAAFDEQYESANRWNSMAFSKFAAEYMRPGSTVNDQEWTEYMKDHFTEVVGDYPTIPTINDHWLEDKVDEYVDNKTQEEVRYALIDWTLSDIEDYLLGMPHYSEARKPFTDQRWENFFQEIWRNDFYGANDYTQEWWVGEDYHDEDKIFKLSLWLAQEKLIDTQSCLDWLEYDVALTRENLWEQVKDSTDDDEWKVVFLWLCSTLTNEEIIEFEDAGIDRDTIADVVWWKVVLPNWDYYNLETNTSWGREEKPKFDSEEKAFAEFMSCKFPDISLTKRMAQIHQVVRWQAYIETILEVLA